MNTVAFTNQAVNFAIYVSEGLCFPFEKMAKKCGREFAGNLHHHGIAWRSGCIDAFIGSIIIHKDGFVKLGGC